jgi:hypothetical protein
LNSARESDVSSSSVGAVHAAKSAGLSDACLADVERRVAARLGNLFEPWQHLVGKR